MKQGDALSPLLFNFAVEYAVRKVQETNLGLDMNDTNQVLAYVEVVNLIDNIIRTIERNADVLLNACKDIGLAVNYHMYMEIGHHEGMIASEHIKMGSNSYEKVNTLNI